MSKEIRQINFRLSAVEIAKFAKLAEKRNITKVDLFREMIENAYASQKGFDNNIKEIQEDLKKLIDVTMKMQMTRKNNVIADFFAKNDRIRSVMQHAKTLFCNTVTPGRSKAEI